MRSIWDLYNIEGVSLENIEKWDKNNIKIDDFLNKTNKINGKIMNDISNYLINNKNSVSGSIAILYKYNLSKSIIDKFHYFLNIDNLLLLKKKNQMLYNKKIEFFSFSTIQKIELALSLYEDSEDYFDIKNLEKVYDNIEEFGSNLNYLINKTYFSNEIIIKILNQLKDDNLIFFTSKGINKISYESTQQDIMDLVNSYIDNDTIEYKCISKILTEYNFSKLSKEINISRAKIKTYCKSLFNFKISNTAILNYFKMINTFHIPFDIFSKIFEINIQTYNFLKYFYMKSRNEIDDENYNVFDEIGFFYNLSSIDKEKYLNIFNLFFENEELIKRNFWNIFDLFIKDNKNTFFTFNELESRLISFAERRNFFIQKGRNTIAKIERSENFIFSFRKKLRYYDYSIIDEKILKKIENIFLSSKGLYSSKYFFDNYSFFSEDLNIKNHYELHNLIKKYFENFKMEKIIIKRMPNILIGYETEKDFYKEMIFEFSPINANDFYKRINLEFGSDINTLKANLPNIMSDYLVDNQYVMNHISLTENQIFEISKTMAENIKDDEIIMIKDLEKIFNFLKISNELLNSKNILKLNYKIQSHYLYKKEYGSFSDALLSWIDKNDIFDKNIFPYFQKEWLFDKWLNEKKIFIFTKNKYITSKKLFNGNFTKLLLEELLEELLSICDRLNEKFYSINMLKKELNDYN